MSLKHVLPSASEGQLQITMSTLFCFAYGGTNTQNYVKLSPQLKFFFSFSLQKISQADDQDVKKKQFNKKRIAFFKNSICNRKKGNLCLTYPLTIAVDGYFTLES